MEEKKKNFRIVKILFCIGLWVYLLILTHFLIFSYEPTSIHYKPPIVIWIVDLVNLFIHEAGHFIFKIFGRTIYFLGGSLLQIALPLSLFIVSIRKNSFSSILPAFWTGESFINVSVYIADAPHKNLRLISKNLIHDWNWILRNKLEYANTLSIIISTIGYTFCFLSLIILTYYIITSFRNK